MMVGQLMRAIEDECTEEELEKGDYGECEPEFIAEDKEFTLRTAAEMYNVLLNMTTGEANAMVRRCPGQGWLAPRVGHQGYLGSAVREQDYEVNQGGSGDRALGGQDGQVADRVRPGVDSEDERRSALRDARKGFAGEGLGRVRRELR